MKKILEMKEDGSKVAVYRIKEAYNALQPLTRMKAAYEKKRAIRQMLGMLEKEISIADDEEAVLIDRLVKKDDKGHYVIVNNHYQFDTEAKENEFIAERTNLNNMVVELHFQPIVIDDVDQTNMRCNNPPILLSIVEEESMKPFVDFIY